MVAIDRIKLRTPPTPEEAERLAKLYVSAFADASYDSITGAYGYAWWVKWGYPAQTELGTNGGVNCRSANQAEYEGCEAALEFIKTLDLTDKIVVLQCDNTFAVGKIELRLKRECLKLGARDAYAKHVKGHVAKGKGGSRHYMNNVCDRKAKEEMRKHRENMK